jgi:hypothetical protein
MYIKNRKNFNFISINTGFSPLNISFFIPLEENKEKNLIFLCFTHREETLAKG